MVSLQLKLLGCQNDLSLDRCINKGAKRFLNFGIQVKLVFQ